VSRKKPHIRDTVKPSPVTGEGGGDVRSNVVAVDGTIDRTQSDAAPLLRTG
jgi:hypothetical protein